MLFTLAVSTVNAAPAPTDLVGFVAWITVGLVGLLIGAVTVAVANRQFQQRLNDNSYSTGASVVVARETEPRRAAA